MQNKPVYNPLNKFYKSRKGAVKEEQPVRFRVKGDFGKVDFVYHKDNEDPLYLPMENKGGYFEITASFSVGLYWYRFDLNNGLFIGQDENLYGKITDEPCDFQLSVYSKDYVVPKWLKGGIIYQIFPDRFNRGDTNPIEFCGRKIHHDLHDDPYFLPDENGKVLNDDFFGGTICGITEKLPYLKSLNVSTVYLNPIFKAFSNHRYDTGDFMQIDPLLGTENDLKELISKANELNIKIILDGVFNHVGDDSVYFNKYNNYPSVGAYQSKESKYYEWFDFISYPDEYTSWWGIKTLPAVNKENPSYIDYICGKNGVLEHYFKLGIGGIRLDVVDELPQNFVRRLRQTIKSVNKNAIIIGEVWEDASNKISYGKRREYFLGKELDSVMNYPLKNAVIDFVKTGNSKGLSTVIKTQIDHYPKNVLDSLMNILSTHDTARILSAVDDVDICNKTKEELSKITLLGENRKTAVFRLKAASLLQYTLCGVPSVYYGDEIGMQGLFDPLNRRFFAWDNVDEEILLWYTQLGEIRKNHTAFQSGTFNEICALDGVYAFTRRDKNGELLIISNVKNNRYKLKFKGKLVNLLDGKIYTDGIFLEKNFLGIFIKAR